MWQVRDIAPEVLTVPSGFIPHDEESAPRNDRRVEACERRGEIALAFALAHRTEQQHHHFVVSETELDPGLRPSASGLAGCEPAHVEPVVNDCEVVPNAEARPCTAGCMRDEHDAVRE